MRLLEYFDHHFIDLYTSSHIKDISDDELLKIFRQASPKVITLLEVQEKLLKEKQHILQEECGFDQQNICHSEALEKTVIVLDKLSDLASKLQSAHGERLRLTEKSHGVQSELKGLIDRFQKQRQVLIYFRALKLYRKLLLLETSEQGFTETELLEAYKELEELQQYALNLAETRLGRRISLVFSQNIGNIIKSHKAKLRSSLKEKRNFTEIDEHENDFVESLKSCVRLYMVDGKISGYDIRTSFVKIAEILSEQVATRFKYHFSGKRKTNQEDKPEWFIGYVLEQVQAYVPLLQNVIQPMANETNAKHLNILHLFIETLISSCVDWRLENSFTIYAESEVLLCHLVDELLAADQELLHQYQYAGYKSMINFLTQDEQRLKLWIQADFVNAVRKVDEIVSSSDAWICGFETESIPSDVKYKFTCKLPESCCEIIALLRKCADRFLYHLDPRKSLAYVSTVQFSVLSTYRLSLKKNLLDPVLSRPHEILSSVSQSSLEGFCLGINTLNQIVEFLSDWSHEPEYVRIFAYQASSEKTISDFRHDILGDLTRRSKEIITASKKRLGNVAMLAIRRQYGQQVRKMNSIESSKQETKRKGIFHPEILELERLQKSAEELLSASLLKEFEEGILEVNFQKEDNSISDANVFCEETLQTLMDQINFIKAILIINPMLRIAESLALDMTNVIITNLIDRKAFTLAGAHCLEQNVKKVFHLFSSLSAKPSNRFFRRLNDTMKILVLSTPKMETLKNELIALRTSQDISLKEERAKFLLKDDYNISTLDLADVLALCSQRS